jgi:ferric-dicitrate binding protein FerR (iron transport regulator)
MKELEFESKLQSFVDGNLDDEDCQEVVARLKADPEAFKKHCDYAALDAGLHHPIVEAAILNSEQEPIEEFTRSARSKKTRFVALLTACAAMVVAAIYLKIILVTPPVARFKATPDAQYRISHSPSKRKDTLKGDELAVGSRVELRSGTLEMNFGSGVQGVVRGPAEFVLRKESLVDLNFGTAWFKVDEKAIGFQVNTPEFLLTDLGTEFGVISQSEFPDQVHVFSGMVRVRNHRGNSETIELIAREARESNKSGRWDDVNFSANQFFTTFSMTAKESRYLHWSFDGNEPWQVNGTLAGADQIITRPVQSDGRAAEGRLVPGMHGKGLSFDGLGDHVTTNWEGILGTKPRTLACWIKLHPGDTPGYAVLADWGGGADPTGGWLARVRPFYNGKGAFLRVACAGNWSIGTADVADGQWHHIAIVDSGRVNSSEFPDVQLYVDGNEDPHSWSDKGAGSSSRSRGTTKGSLFVLGRPFPEVNQQLHGTIDELFVFEHALDQNAVRRLMITSAP